MRSGPANTSLCPRWVQAWGRRRQGPQTPPILVSVPPTTSKPYPQPQFLLSASFLLCPRVSLSFRLFFDDPPTPLTPPSWTHEHTHTCSHAESQTQRHKATWLSTNLYSPSATLLGLWPPRRTRGLPGGGLFMAGCFARETPALSCMCAG